MSESSAFIRVAGLYAKTSRSGNPLHFGRWGSLRLYLFPNDVGRKAKDCQPEYWLAIRIEDWDAKRDGPPATEKETK